MWVTCPAQYFPFYHPNIIQLCVSCSWKQHYLYHITTWTPPFQLAPRKVNNDTHTNVKSPATPKAVQKWLQQSNDICIYRPAAHGWKSQHTFRPAAHGWKSQHTFRLTAHGWTLQHTFRPTAYGWKSQHTFRPAVHGWKSQHTFRPAAQTENHITLKNRDLSMHSVKGKMKISSKLQVLAALPPWKEKTKLRGP